MREFTVNLPLQRVALDDFIDRAAWVPHVTVHSNVTTEADPLVVVDAVRAATDGVGPIDVIAGEEARFGPEGSMLVNLVRAPALKGIWDVLGGGVDGGGAANALAGDDSVGVRRVRVAGAGAADEVRVALAAVLRRMSG